MVGEDEAAALVKRELGFEPYDRMDDVRKKELAAVAARWLDR